MFYHNPYRDSYNLRKGVNIFLPIFSVFFLTDSGHFGQSVYSLCGEAAVIFVKIRGVNVLANFTYGTA